jgi:Xaa-Pro dipeptidase
MTTQSRSGYGPAFERGEYESRLARVSERLEAESLDGLICIAPESLFYLCGYDAHTHFSEQALMIDRDSEPILVIRDVDGALAEESAAVGEVRTYHHGSEDPAELIGGWWKERHPGTATIGVETMSFAAPWAYGMRLERAFDGVAALRDASEVVGRLRVVKSPAELAYVREAARLNNLGVAAAIEHAKPGISELELAAEIDYAMRRAGSEYPAMPVWLESGRRTLAGHGTPTTKALEPGDPVTFCFGSAKRRYNVTSYRTISLGEPSEAFRHHYDIAKEGLRALVDATRPGVPVKEASAAAAAVFGEAGFSSDDLMRWGYGVGIGYPPSHLEMMLDITEDSDDVYAAGMVMCLHAGIYDESAGYGVMVGGDYILNEDSIEPVDKLGPDLQVL